jgi:glycosyltransferase involved in cell wall biosynthesis
MNGVETPGARVAILGIKALPALAGADRVVEQLLDSFSPANRYTIYLLRDAAPAMSCSHERHYVYIPALKGKHLRAPSYFLLCCLHYLVKGRYDIAHVHNSDFGLFCPLLKLKRRVRIIGTFHGDPAKREKWNWAAKIVLRASEAIFVRACDALTSVSPEKSLARREVRYIPNGLDRRPPSKPIGTTFPYAELELHEGRFLMFACGRLDRTKGLHHLLAAYGEMVSDRRLLVVGDFSHDPRYSQAIVRAALQDERVVLHQALLAKDTLAEVLGKCAVFVFPSEVEGMSMMLMEAIASGAPVVASDITANLAVVGADYPYVFRSGDSQALRLALESALGATVDRRDLSRMRERIATSFRWEGIARAYEKVYEGESLGTYA